MKLREQLTAVPRQRPAPAVVNWGVRQAKFYPAEGYQVVSATPTTGPDEDQIPMCGLLQGGRYPVCNAPMCYPSEEARRANAFSTGHGPMSEKKDNPFPPGSAAALTYVDSEKVTAQIENAAAYAEAARAEFEAQAAQPDPATVAAAAASEAAYRIGLDQLERDRMLAEAQAEQAALLDARLRRLGG